MYTYFSWRISFYRCQDGRICDPKTSTAEHEWSQAETEMILLKKRPSIQNSLYQRWRNGGCAHSQRSWLPRHDLKQLGDQNGQRESRNLVNKSKYMFEISRAAFVSTTDRTGCHQLRQRSLSMCIKKATRLGIVSISDFDMWLRSWQCFMMSSAHRPVMMYDQLWIVMRG